MKDRDMERITKVLTNLFQVKSIVTFGVIFTICILAIKQNVAIPSELLAAIASSIVTYFFTRKDTTGGAE